MNRTMTVVVALIAAAGLSTMVYSVPEQRALAWFGGSCGYGCGGPFFVHKQIIQTIHQVNNCTGNGEDQNQKGKQTICLNTAVNNAGHSFGANGVGTRPLGDEGLIAVTSPDCIPGSIYYPACLIIPPSL